MTLHLGHLRIEPRDPGLMRAIARAGGVAELARKLGIAQPSVSNWSRVPARRVVAVEALTGVSRHELRPDLYDGAPAAAGWSADNSEIAVSRQIAYGADEQQRLDIFAPAGANEWPTLVFAGGSSFTRANDGERYDHIAGWFAHHGFVAVNVGVRRTQDVRFPAGTEDLACAIDWVTSNIARHGGNPDHVVLMGHAAGGWHVASYLLDAFGSPRSHAAIKAAILLSAWLRPERLSEPSDAADAATYGGIDSLGLHSPVDRVERCHWPVLVAFAEHENQSLDVQGLEFAGRLASMQRRAPRVVQVPGHDHESIVTRFNSGEHFLGRQILDFLAAGPSRETGTRVAP